MHFTEERYLSERHLKGRNQTSKTFKDAFVLDIFGAVRGSEISLGQ